MRDFSQNTNALSINTATVRFSEGKLWPLNDIIHACSKAGIRTIAPWRDQVHAIGLAETARLLKETGTKLSGYCRGGFFTGADAAARQAALDDNRRAIDEAKTLWAPCLVLVVGSLPGAIEGKPQYTNITRARAEVAEGIAKTLEYARSVNMPLAIEPLHPMQAAERACINTIEQALDLCDQLDPNQTGALGVAVDAYHTWWDPKLTSQIERAGKARLLAWHVCDWLTPTNDLLNDRGMMGDGVIDLKGIRATMEAAGYKGYSEVEIFSQHWWKQSGVTVLAECTRRHKTVC